MIFKIFIVYICIGAIVSIPLARTYWINFRESDSKQNIILPNKLLNRLVDSYVFMIAWCILMFTYPIQIIENIIKKIKENKNA